MDVGFFLKDRIVFIKQFFAAASFPFTEKKRMIEAEEEPFVPTYSEDGEPPFLNEWIEADESFQVLGYSCISMLSAALHLYLRTWEAELGVPVGDSLKTDFKQGWFNGYNTYFANNFGVDFEKSPADLTMLEEIVLVRNRIQHSVDLFTPRTTYLPTDIKKLPHVFFANDAEVGLLSDVKESERSWLFPPSVHITEEKFMLATIEVEKFSIWLDDEILKCVYSR
ncbi:MAG: hypothetical protein AB7U43_11005 [Desulfobacter sp.]